MLGKNPVRAQELTDGQTLWIQSIFYTLQGEGPFTGQPAVFIRLAGCNLRCTWCDTDFESSTWTPGLGEILKLVKDKIRPNCKLVVITGGEPLRQNIAPLVERLLEIDLTVQLETNGTLWVDLPEHPNLHIICSPKVNYIHERLLPRITTFKYVLAAGETDPLDGLPIASTQQVDRPMRIVRPPENASIYVMPLDTGDTLKNSANQQACVDIAMRFGYNLTLQTHKILNID